MQGNVQEVTQVSVWDKFLVLVLLTMIVCAFAYAGFWYGKYHALTDMNVSYHAGIVTFELDGHAYEHIAEGWVASR